jgi:hypothetical protein
MQKYYRGRRTHQRHGPECQCMGCLQTAKFLKNVSGRGHCQTFGFGFAYLESPHHTNRVYLVGEGAETKPTARRTRLDLTFQTRADVCQRDMGRGEGSVRMFHSPSARHSQTFPPCARGIRLTRPGCGALGAGLGALPRNPGCRSFRAALGLFRYKLGARCRVGATRNGGLGSGFGLGFPAPFCGFRSGRADGGSGWAFGVRAVEAARSLTPRGAEAAAAAQADNELASARSQARLGPALLRPASSSLSRSSVGGVPSPLLRAPRALGDPAGRAVGWRRRAHTPPP